VRRLVPTLAFAAGVIIVDQLTKHWALQELQDRDIELFWTLQLNLVFNEGASFSLGGGRGWLFGILALAMSAVLLRWASRLASLPARLAIGAIVGGAIGNLIDRAFRDGDGFLGGRVVDFFDLQWWPVFNIADIGIVVGAVALALVAFVQGDDALVSARPEEEGDALPPAVASDVATTPEDGRSGV
jgi:signal peptidase II